MTDDAERGDGQVAALEAAVRDAEERLALAREETARRRAAVVAFEARAHEEADGILALIDEVEGELDALLAEKAHVSTQAFDESRRPLDARRHELLANKAAFRGRAAVEHARLVEDLNEAIRTERRIESKPRSGQPTGELPALRRRLTALGEGS